MNPGDTPPPAGDGPVAATSAPAAATVPSAPANRLASRIALLTDLIDSDSDSSIVASHACASCPGNLQGI
jgi:hypothetical protein